MSRLPSPYDKYFGCKSRSKFQPFTESNCLGRDSNPVPSEPKPNTLPRGHRGRYAYSFLTLFIFQEVRDFPYKSEKVKQSCRIDPATFATEAKLLTLQPSRQVVAISLSRLVMLRSLSLTFIKRTAMPEIRTRDLWSRGQAWSPGAIKAQGCSSTFGGLVFTSSDG